jgi:hypothetical protein
MSIENPTHQSSNLGNALQQFLNNDPNLRLIKLASKLSGAKLSVDEGTWVSKNSRTTNEITIGTQELPEAVKDRWQWGTKDVDEEMIVKTGHELAHQWLHERGFEGALTRWLDGDSNIRAEHAPLIRLYALLTQTGRTTGLSTEQIYSEQSRNTGKLDVAVLEDATQLIAAYLIGDEYFNFMLDHSVSGLSQAQQQEIATYVIQICNELH